MIDGDTGRLDTIMSSRSRHVKDIIYGYSQVQREAMCTDLSLSQMSLVIISVITL